MAGATVAPAIDRPPNHVVVRWRGGEEFESGRPGGPTLRVDGNAKCAQSPVDVLLTALAACSSIDVVEVPRQAAHARAVAGGRRRRRARERSGPAKGQAIVLTFRIAGEGIEREHAERAIDLAVNKYCSVRDSLDPKTPVEWKLELEG